MSSGLSGCSSSTISRLQRSSELAGGVVDVGDSAGHSGGEIAAGGADDHDPAAGHVFAAVIADAFDDGFGAAVADAEPFADDAAEINLPGDRAVADDVAGDDVFLGLERGFLGRIDDDAAAGEALAAVVVGVAFQFERDAAGQEAAEALSGRAVEFEMDRPIGQAGMAVLAGDFAGKDRADGAVDVVDGQARRGLFRRAPAPARPASAA